MLASTKTQQPSQQQQQQQIKAAKATKAPVVVASSTDASSDVERHPMIEMMLKRLRTLKKRLVSDTLLA